MPTTTLGLFQKEKCDTLCEHLSDKAAKHCGSRKMTTHENILKSPLQMLCVALEVKTTWTGEVLDWTDKLVSLEFFSVGCWNSLYFQYLLIRTHKKYRQRLKK